MPEEFFIIFKALLEVPKGVSLEDNLITDLLFKDPDFPGIYGAISNIDFFGLIVMFCLHNFIVIFFL